MSITSWAQACAQQRERPQESLERSSYGSNSFTIASFCASFVVSSYWLLLWVRFKRRWQTSLVSLRNVSPSSDGEQGPRAKIWRHFGAFAALVCAGSLSGIIAWSFNIRSYPPFFASFELRRTGPRVEFLRSLAAATLYYGSFFTPNAIEFLCLSLAKMLVIARLVKFVRGAAPTAMSEDSKMLFRRKIRRILIVFKVCAACCALSGMAGIIGSIGATQLYMDGTAARYEAADATNSTTGQDTPASRAISSRSNELFTSGANWISAQIISEAVMLFFLVIGYSLVGFPSVVILRNIMAVIDNARRRCVAGTAKFKFLNELMTSVAAQRRQLLSSCALIYVTFIPRAVFGVLNAIGNINVVFNRACEPCETCQSLNQLVSTYLNSTPEFQAIVVAMSSPLPLTVSIFFMLNASERRLLRMEVHELTASNQSAEVLFETLNPT